MFRRGEALGKTVFSKKGQMNMSFGWIFALIAGGVILFLTIYGISNFMGTAQKQQTSADAQEIQVLFNPLQTSFSSAVSSYIERTNPTRIHNRCSPSGQFGDQIMSLSVESVDGWTDRGVPSRFENKYVFSNETVQGQTFYIFSKPFDFPYQVSDLIYLTSGEKTYCFKSPPEDIKKELKDLNQNNLVVGCSGSSNDAVEVCFESSGCDVDVDYSEGSDYSNGVVEKSGAEMHFHSDALMYAAIFSDKENYECQLGRLFKRTQNLASIYADKHSYMERTSCQSNFRTDLARFSQRITVPDDPSDLDISEDSFENTGEGSLSYFVAELEEKNDGSSCSLW